MIETEIRRSLFSVPNATGRKCDRGILQTIIFGLHIFVSFMTTNTQYFEYEIAHTMLEMEYHASHPTVQKARTKKLKFKDTTISTFCYNL